ncbi:hypothetical protein D3C76_1777140 [compost metagenome]
MNGDAGAAPVNAVGHADSPTVRTDHALTDRQAQARPLPPSITPGGGVEHVEDLRPLFLGNTRAFITHGEKQFAVADTGTQLQAAMDR